MEFTRHETAILNAVRLRGASSIAELADQLCVSDETIRRHVKPLVRKGLVIRVHGGVVLPDRLQEAPFQRRLQKNRDAKQRIARAMAEQIEDGDSMIIDCGSTTAYVALALQNRSNLHVITNSVEIARTLASRNQNRVYVTGGELRADDAAAFGKPAIDFIQQFHVDYAILSIAAVNDRLEFLDQHLAEAEFSRAAIAQARETCVVVDHGKFGRNGLVRVCGLEEIDLLVTDKAPPAALSRECQTTETRLAIAEPD